MLLQKIKKIFLISLGCFFLGLFLCPNLFCDYDYEGDEIILIQGEFKGIEVDDPKRVSIDDPRVVDIKEASAKELFIEAKAPGQTKIRIWEKGRKRIVNFRVLREDLDKLRSRIKRLLYAMELEDIYLSLDNETQKIVLNGEIQPRQEKDYNKIKSQFKDKILDLVTIGPERGLVEVEVQILELTKDAQKTLGFNWIDSLQFTEGSSEDTEKGTSLGEFGQVFKDLFHVSDWNRNTLNFTIDMLEKEGKLRILSRPKVVCLSGKSATFQVGGDVPIVGTTVSTTGSTQSVSFKSFGILLNIQPTIVKERSSDEEIIQTSISTEVSDVNVSTSSGAAQVNETLVVPAFTTNSAQTELYLKDNQTVFIAGLIKSKSDVDIEKVPWLANIPILGALFRSKSDVGEERELVISVTPKIVGQKKEPEVNNPESKKGSQIPNISARLKKYIMSLAKMINRTAEYPELAKQAGFQGTVKLNLHILSSGEVNNISILKSSGSHILDDAAIKSVKSLAPFYPFPLGMAYNDIWIDVPIEYRLD